ncbi:MAG: DUF3570 domain-containing protein [Gammaproteobacteria bacterium]
MAAPDTRRLVLLGIAALSIGVAEATQLPEDRADMLWHSYDGGGVTIEGPSLLVRKAAKNKFSIWANYYVDMISGASIDVQATASEYSEFRQQVSGGIDYLLGKTLMGASYTRSKESDYLANNFSFSISQDLFGDLTNFSLSYAYGWDTITRSTDNVFEQDAQRQSYRLDLSQILTKNMVLGFTYHTITDEGFLNNPYRSVRYLDPTSGNGYSYESEVYPNTRTSNAAAARTMYYLPWRAALRGEYRYFTDSWGIEASNWEASYTQPLFGRFEVDVRARHYEQTRADFYSDLFPFRQAQNFLARDKELSTFTSNSVGATLTYNFSKEGFLWFDKGSVSVAAEYIYFRYDNFRDVTSSAPVGTEPLYDYYALALRALVSFWY